MWIQVIKSKEDLKFPLVKNTEIVWSLYTKNMGTHVGKYPNPTEKIRCPGKNFRDKQKLQVMGKRNFQRKKHRTKVNSEIVGAIFPVASTYAWDSSQLDLTTPVTPSSSVFLTSAAIPTSL